MKAGRFIFWFVVVMLCAAIPALLIPAGLILAAVIYGKVVAKRREREMFAPREPIYVQPEQVWRNPGWRP